MQSKSEKILFGGILVFLACYFMQIFDMPNLLSVAIGAVFCAILLFKQKKFRFDIATSLLVATLAIYFIKDMDVVRAFTSHSFYEVVIMYVLGNYLACEITEKDNKDGKLFFALASMVLGLTVHGFLNSYTFLDKQWIYEDFFRIWKDFWSGEYVHGTMQVLYYLPAFALMLPAILYFKKKKIWNLCVIFSAVFFAYISIVSQSRSSVLILPIACLGQLLMLFFIEKENIKKYINKKSMIIVFGTLVIGVMVIAVLLFGTSVGKSFIGIMDRDGGIFNNIRFKIQRSALEQLPMYPMGGNQMDHLGFAHAHNLWLDIADIGGIIPFVAFTIYTLITAFETIKFAFKSEFAKEIKISVVGLYAVYFLFFSIEPGLNWHVYFITPWLFLHGLVHGCVKKSKLVRQKC